MSIQPSDLITIEFCVVLAHLTLAPHVISVKLAHLVHLAPHKESLVHTTFEVVVAESTRTIYLVPVRCLSQADELPDLTFLLLSVDLGVDVLPMKQQQQQLLCHRAGIRDLRPRCVFTLATLHFCW